MDWYTQVWRKYADFTGRARRKEYWMFVLINTAITMLLGTIDGTLRGIAGTDISFLSSLYSLAVLLPTIAVGVRRLHDTSRSGLFLLLAFVPLVNLVLLFFFIQEGTAGPNQYGPDLKTAERGVIAAAGWLPDPTGRHELRYWDSVRWTEQVSNGGIVSTDAV